MSGAFIFFNVKCTAPHFFLWIWSFKQSQYTILCLSVSLFVGISEVQNSNARTNHLQKPNEHGCIYFWWPQSRQKPQADAIEKSDHLEAFHSKQCLPLQHQEQAGYRSQSSHGQCIKTNTFSTGLDIGKAWRGMGWTRWSTDVKVEKSPCLTDKRNIHYKND